MTYSFKPLERNGVSTIIFSMWDICFILKHSFLIEDLNFRKVFYESVFNLRAEANLPSPQIWSLNNKALSMLSGVCDAVAIGLWGSEPLYRGRRGGMRNRWAVRSAERAERSVTKEELQEGRCPFPIFSCFIFICLVNVEHYVVIMQCVCSSFCADRMRVTMCWLSDWWSFTAGWVDAVAPC